MKNEPVKPVKVLLGPDEVLCIACEKKLCINKAHACLRLIDGHREDVTTILHLGCVATLSEEQAADLRNPEKNPPKTIHDHLIEREQKKAARRV